MTHIESLRIPRELLVAVVTALTARAAEDRHIAVRVDGADIEAAPLRIADYAHGLWDACRRLAASEGLAEDELFELVRMAANMTCSESTDTTCQRALATIAACDRVIAEQARPPAQQSSTRFSRDVMNLDQFLRPFFNKHAKPADRVAKFRGYLTSATNADYAASLIRRWRENLMPLTTARAYEHHFAKHLEITRTQRAHDRAVTANLARQSKKNE